MDVLLNLVSLAENFDLMEVATCINKILKEKVTIRGIFEQTVVRTMFLIGFFANDAPEHYGLIRYYPTL